jgi:hypothetical protein
LTWRRRHSQTSRTKKPGLSRRFRPGFEVFEDRNLLNTLTVLNANDSGPGLLRAASLREGSFPASR